jgi:hypothetical protein
MLKLLRFTAKLSVFCLMLIGVLFSLSGMSVMRCVSVVHIFMKLIICLCTESIRIVSCNGINLCL